MAKPRTKHPSLREQLNEKTREVILDAMVDLLGESGSFDFSVFETARRAKMSPRTIYRHFPTREDLFEAMSAHVNKRVGFAGYPTTPDGVVALARKLFPAFDQNEKLILAQINSRIGQTFRDHARKGRARAMQTAVDSIAPNLPEDLRVEMTAICHCLLSSDSWNRMRNDFGLDGKRSGEAVAWALEVMFEAIARKNAKRGKSK